MLVVLGFNHNSTELAIREQLVFDSTQLQDDLPKAYNQIKQNCLTAELSGLIIVSTCNRTEFLFGLW